MIWGRKVFMMIKLFGVLNCKIGAKTPIFFMEKFKIGLTILLCSSIIKEKQRRKTK